MAFSESHREPCKHGTQRLSPRLQRVGDEKPDRFVSDPIDLLELLSLLQLGNRRNGPRTACRTPAFYASPTRGSASPEGPPESPSRRRASLSFRNGVPTTSPEGLRPVHRILRRARPRPAISMASAIQLCRPERQPGRCGRTNEALVERPPPSPTRTFERASRRTPALRREPADPRPHLPDPKAHGTRTGLARDEPAARSRSRPLPKGSGWNRSGSPSPQPRFRCRNQDRDESFDLEFTGLNQQPPSQTWIRRPLPEKSGSQSQPEHDLTPRPPSPPPEGDSNRNRTAESARSVRTRRHSEAFGPSTPKDRDAWSSEEPASPALGSRKPSSSWTCRRPGPEGSWRFELRRAVEPSARRI
jgi:hypothetical protein